MRKSIYLLIQCLVMINFLYMPTLLSAQLTHNTLLAKNMNQTDAFYLAMNSNSGGRQQVMDSLDTLQKKQTDMYNMLKGKASKAGARRIIHLTEELTEKIEALSENKADKADLTHTSDALNQSIDDLMQEIKSLSKTLTDDIKNISNSLIKISSQTIPHQRIQILAEIKNEQKNIKERIAELNEQLHKITAKTSRNRQTEMSKLADTQEEIDNDYAEIKQNLQENKNIASRNFFIVLFLVIIFIGALAGWVYYFIYHQQEVKNEIYKNTKIIVQEQYERLLEQLYIEEHEDGRLTADDLKKMSERVKKKVIRQNWAKRKIEDRPAFI